MASDLSKVQLGPCKVTFDVGGTTPIVFETTQGGVALTYEETSREVVVDQYGTTPVKEIITGRQAMIAIPFAEKDLDKLAAIIPGAELVTDAVDPTKKRVDIIANKVINLYDYAKVVKLEPLDEAATANDAVILYKAAPRPQLNYTYDYNNELITNINFKGFPDAANKLIGFGDDTATA